MRSGAPGRPYGPARLGIYEFFRFLSGQRVGQEAKRTRHTEIPNSRRDIPAPATLSHGEDEVTCQTTTKRIQFTTT